MTTHETVSLATGGVSFFLPVVSLPQRGGKSLDIGFVLSGNTYSLKETENSFQENGDVVNHLVPQLTTIQSIQTQNAPWFSILHPNLPTLTADLSYAGMDSHLIHVDPPVWLTNPEYCMQNWSFTDWDGSSHSFNGTKDCSMGDGEYYLFNETIALNHVTSPSTDDSFYILDATNSADIRVTKRDGTVYHFGGYNANYVQQLCIPCASSQDLTFLNRYAAIAGSVVDTNGNVTSIANNIVTDTVGRKITASPRAISYEAMNGTSAELVTATVSAPTTGGYAPWPIQYPAYGPNNQAGPCTPNYVNPNPSADQEVQLIYEGPGVNGSGGYPTQYTITLQNQSTYTLSFDVTGNLIQVVYPSGGYTKYDYQYGRMLQTQNFQDVTCVVPTTELLAKHECALASGSCTPAPTSTTINTCVAGSPVGGEATTCYSGLYGTLQPGGTSTEGAGDSPAIVIDPYGNRSVHASGGNFGYSEGAGSNGTSVSFYIGYYAAYDEYDAGQSAPLKTITRSFGDSGTGCYTGQTPWNLQPCDITTTDYTSGSPQSSVQKFTYDNVGFPNITGIQQLDFSGNVISTTSATWEHGGIYQTGAPGATTVNNVLDHLQSSTVTDPVSGNSVTKGYTYDGIGNLEQIAVSGTNVPTLTTTYTPLDSYGRPTQMTDPKGNITKYSYNTDNSWFDATCAPPTGSQAYLTGVTNALNQTTSYTYDSCTGELGSMTDSNGQTTSFYYDEMARTQKISYPDGGWKQNTYVDTAPLSIETTKSQSPNPNVVANVVLDGFARTSQAQLLSDPYGADYTDTTYDALGRVASVSNPYRPASPTATDGVTQYGYDALSRKTLQVQPDGSSLQWCYSGMTDPHNPQTNCRTNLSSVTGTWVDQSDEVGNNRQQISDAIGRLRGVVEPYGYETDYAYDGFGNLLQVDQWNGLSGSATERQRVFTYDSLSRLVTSKNPEAGTICYGQWNGGAVGSGSCQAGYDGDGNLVSKTDARGVVTSFSYDSLNRLIAKTFSNAPAGTLSSCYQYGVLGQTATNGIGRLESEWAQSGSCTSTLPATGAQSSRTILAYDPLGRIKKEQQCTPGNCTTTSGPYTLHYDYDLAGNLTHAGDGIGQAAWFPQYDSAGRLSGVSASTLFPTQFYPSQLFSAVPTTNCPQPYTAAGALAGWTSGSNSGVPALTGCRTYDQRERPTSEMVTGHD